MFARESYVGHFSWPETQSRHLKSPYLVGSLKILDPTSRSQDFVLKSPYMGQPEYRISLRKMFFVVHIG